MWTAPQTEAESPEQPTRKALEAKDRLDEGRGKQEWGKWKGGKGKAKKEGKGDV
jgi:hypothetical protein